MASHSDRRDSGSELLHELEALSQSLFQSIPTRHNASLVLDRSSMVKDSTRSNPGLMSQRLFLPRWQSQSRSHPSFRAESAAPREKKGIWSWRPLRALSHITMQRIGCLVYVKVVAIRNLPSSTDGLRVRISVRKKETKEGSVSTMPVRIINGSAEFDETLFIQCHLYYKGKLPVFERRLFAILVVAADATELDLGTSTVDLSQLVKESIEKSFEGVRVREWDMNFELLGKAKGGELVLKLGFQIMDGGGTSIYNQAEALMKTNKGNDSLDPSISELKVEDPDCPENETVGKRVSGEVVKEVVHQRITELESIAKQIKELESIMTRDESDLIDATRRNEEQIRLNASEELATRKFLQMLEQREGEEPNKHDRKPSSEIEVSVPISNLGKGLGPIVQTRDGGYLVSTNLFNVKVEKEESLKLAMQISKPFILQDQKQDSGLEVFQSLASMDPQELTSKLSSLTVMDELTGKTAEQVAFEGISSAIMNGRNKEGASFSAARSITTTKMLAKAIVEGSSNAKKSLMSMEEILAFSMKKIEEMVGEGLKIQAEMAEEEAPSDISNSQEVPHNILDSSTPLEEWEKTCDVATDRVNLLVTIQPRDAIRQYEPIGGLLIALVEAVKLESNSEDEEVKFKLSGIHVGGLKLRSEEGYRQRLSAMQWLAGFGMSKAGKNKKVMEGKIRKDFMWSLSSKLMGYTWLQPKRNPNVKFL